MTSQLSSSKTKLSLLQLCQEKNTLLSFHILQPAIKQERDKRTGEFHSPCRLAWRRRRSSQHGLHWFDLGPSPAPCCLPLYLCCFRACRWVDVINLLRATSWRHIDWVSRRLCKLAVAPDCLLTLNFWCECLCCFVNTLISWPLTAANQMITWQLCYCSCYTTVMWLSLSTKLLYSKQSGTTGEHWFTSYDDLWPQQSVTVVIWLFLFCFALQGTTVIDCGVSSEQNLGNVTENFKGRCQKS